MAVLKKINASTLMETLVATVLIVVIFMIASMILNNLFSNSIKMNTRGIDNHLKELEYLHNYKKINIPYNDEYKIWDISIKEIEQGQGEQTKILIEVTNRETKQYRARQINDY